MIVVSDTTPLNYLVLIQADHVLPALFEQVFIPPSVLRELTHPNSPATVRRWCASKPSWLQVVAPQIRHAFAVKLDDGEADALSLAKELNVREVLMDERKGRKVALSEGLIPVPTLTIIEFAAERNLLQLRPALDALQQTTFRVSPDLLTEILKRDAARRSI